MFSSDCLSFDFEGADDIKKTIPIGNSHIGCLVYGNVFNEKLVFNENTFWVKQKNKKIKNREFYKNIKIIENLIDDDRILDANKFALDNIESNQGLRSVYKEPLSLDIKYGNQLEFSNYNRILDMTTGEVLVSYNQNKDVINRKYFSSIKDDLICIHTESTKEEEIEINFDNICNLKYLKKYDNSVFLCIKFNSIHYFYCTIKIVANSVISKNLALIAKGDKIDIYISMATTLYNINAKHLIHSLIFKKIDYKKINEDSIKEYQKYYLKQSFHTNNNMIDSIYNFSRYLAISSSLLNAPMTINGLWSFDNTDITYNLGGFMVNYSNAYGANLFETVNPLISFIKLLNRNGKIKAKKMYKSKGSFSFNNYDYFGNTFLKGDSLNISYNPLGQTNLVTFILDYYRFTKDIDFLKALYPIIKSNVEFVIDNLKKDSSNKYTFYPATSIGDTFKIDNTVCAFADGCTSDDTFIYELMYDYVLANRAVGIEEEENKPFVDIILNQRYIGINNKGLIMPYHSDFKAAHPSMSLLTQLINVYSKDFKPTSVVVDADKATLLKAEEYKMNGSLRASVTGFYTNLSMPNEALKSINKFIELNISETLLSCDDNINLMGNFQMAKAIHDMFLVPKYNKLYLTPCVIKDITSFTLKGFPIYNDIIVDLFKTIDEFVLIAQTKNDKELVINYKNKDYYINLKSGSNRIDLKDLLNLS